MKGLFLKSGLSSRCEVSLMGHCSRLSVARISDAFQESVTIMIANGDFFAAYDDIVSFDGVDFIEGNDIRRVDADVTFVGQAEKIGKIRNNRVSGRSILENFI